MDRNDLRHELAQQLRVDSVRWPEGGLGDAVLGALAESGETCHVRKLAVGARATA